MAAAAQNEVEIEGQEGQKGMQLIYREVSKLNETEKIKLLQLMKEKQCLWSCDVKATTDSKQHAMSELEEAFGFKFTAGELMAAWRSL